MSVKVDIDKFDKCLLGFNDPQPYTSTSICGRYNQYVSGERKSVNEYLSFS